jgi:MFS family permease
MRRFRVLARAPHGQRLVAGAIMLAPGQAAIDLVLLIGLHRATGSFGAAGAGVAVFTICSSLSNPLQSRVVDRAGRPRPLLWVAAAEMLCAGAFCGALAAGAGAGWLLALAAGIGAFTPASGASLRALWSARLADSGERATAFAFISLTQDGGYLAGPAAFGALAAAVSVTAALLGCAAILAAGTALVATLPGFPEPVDSRVPSPTGRAPGLRSLVPVAATMVCVGGALGALDVSTTAFAVQHGAASQSGVLLGVGSIGGIAGGVWYGSRTWRSGLQARLAACALLSAALLVPPALAPNVGLAAVALLLAGGPVSATLTTGYLVADRHGPASRRTEAFALVGLALNVGVAAGNAAAGAIANDVSAHVGFLLASACVLVGAGTSLRRR